MDGVTPGQIVRYVVGAITERPANVKAGDEAVAVIVGVLSDGVTVNLRVLYDAPQDAYAEYVPYAEIPIPHSWHWSPKA